MDDLSVLAERLGRIGSLDLRQALEPRGAVVEVGDGMAWVVGLSEVGSEELVAFDSGALGMAYELTPERTGVVLLGGVDRDQTTRRFGTLLENVGFDATTGRLNLDDASLTENTRAAYPISHIARAAREGSGGHPTNILMLTADAFGVLPPIAKLSAEQAVYHFLSGYTPKVSGTEAGVIEPKATFSPCFGAPFMAPTVYARLLGDRIARHRADVWLVNTGWTGGPYGTGRRMPIAATRALVRAALDGSLRQAPTRPHAAFGAQVPTACAGVPSELLDPRGTWSDGGAYDERARRLAELFRDNFRHFESEVSSAIASAGAPAVRGGAS